MAVTAVNLDDRENLILAAKMTHNQEIIDVAEVLNETNEPLMDFIVQRANDITSHVISRRTALPGSEWVKVGNGWDATTGLRSRAPRWRPTAVATRGLATCSTAWAPTMHAKFYSPAPLTIASRHDYMWRRNSANRTI